MAEVGPRGRRGLGAGGGGSGNSKDAALEANNDASTLQFLYTNTQSLVNKIEEMRLIVADNKPDILIITKTWTNETISDNYLNIDGYDVIERKDRNDTEKGRGGGIIMYARKSLYAWKLNCDTMFNQCGMIGVKLKRTDLQVLVVYRSPNSSKVNDDELCDFVGKMNGTYVIVGDFNLPDIRWQNGCAGSKGRKFLETISDKFLTQHINSATHDGGNILDLVISSEEELVKDVEMCGNVGKSDHSLIKYKVEVDVTRSNNRREGRNFRRARKDEMRRAMRLDWRGLLEGKTVDETWSYIKEKLDEIVAQHVPMKKAKYNNEPKWLDAEMRKMIVQKRDAWKKWKRTGRASDKAVYTQTEKRCKRMIRNKKNAYERNIVNNRNTNPKLYYSYVNSAKKNRSHFGPLKNDSGEFVIDPMEQAETMNGFYSSVFTRSNGEPRNAFLCDIEVTEERVKSAIDGMRENAASGPDEIPPILLKMLRDEIAVPLTILFQKSIDAGQIPDDWRKANVVPIYKKGSKAEPGNYRLVCLTSVTGKLLERLMKNDIDAHIENNDLIRDSQHGFCRGRSTQTNLVEFLNVTTKWHDEGKCYDVFYLDFSKAFDVVCHKRLLVKLEAIGIGGKVLKWIEDWLARRIQRVVINGNFSDWIAVISSVIQGSVLGGIFFDIFIDDIDEAIIEALIKKFADDTKLAKVIRNIADAQQMQENLDQICEWAERWQMCFNVKKCKVMHFGRQNIRYRYTMNESEIEKVNEEKDLGVWIEDDMRSSKQCRVAAQNANWALGQLSRAFHYRKASSIVPLYKTFVRPKLEHAVAAWSPWLEGDKETIEKVQRRLVKMISDKRGDTYKERLTSIGLTSLTERRSRGDIIETFRTINGFNRVNKENWFTFRDLSNSRTTRATVSISGEQQHSRENVLYKESVRLDSRKNFFSVRVVDRWNSIPDEIKAQKTVNAFKNSFDEWSRSEAARQQ